jgi:hypothetical protein
MTTLLVLCLFLVFISLASAVHLRSTGIEENVSTQNISSSELEHTYPEYFAARRILEDTIHSNHDHNEQLEKWKAELVEVNGLRNTDVAVLITSSTNNAQKYLWERIIPSARTWMRLFVNVFVVVEG